VSQTSILFNQKGRRIDEYFLLGENELEIREVKEKNSVSEHYIKNIYIVY
jgi:hypothetical protein